MLREMKLETVWARWGGIKDCALRDRFDELVPVGRTAKPPREHYCKVMGGYDGAMHRFGAQVRGEVLEVRCVPITEEEFAQMVATGQAEIEIPEPLVSDVPFEDALGEVRAAFDGVPSQEKWALLVGALDRCVPRDLERLVAYAQKAMEAWDDAPMPAGEVPGDARLASWIDPSWAGGLPEGELRVAPPSWVAEMALGGRSPKYRLVRVLHLGRMKINWGIGRSILGNPDLTGVTHLNLGDNALCHSKRFYPWLRRQPVVRAVKHWTVYGLTLGFEEAILGLDGEHGFESLEHFEQCLNGYVYDRLFPRLRRFPCMEGVTITTRGVEEQVFEYIS